MAARLNPLSATSTNQVPVILDNIPSEVLTHEWYVRSTLVKILKRPAPCDSTLVIAKSLMNNSSKASA
ncbi:MAG: hypothetical protein R3E60_05410 [Alphaproteobacteria bacterium]